MPDLRPKVSIVTPVFNRAGIVHKTIDSVIAQTWQNWELLLVDDGSTDNIEELLADRYGAEKRISFSRRDRGPKGASTCRNIGAQLATGDYLVFLDSDDMLEPHCLEQRVQVMAAEPGLDFAVFRFRFLGHRGEYIENNFDNGLDPLINFLSGKSYWAIMCPIWKKSTFAELGGFNSIFPRYQDIEISIRALTRPGIAYRMCMGLPPDTIVIPSVKKQSVLFAADIHESLNLLVPQTAACLEKVNKAEYMKFMEGYLKEWLRFYAHANFIGGLQLQCNELLELFHRSAIISRARLWQYRVESSVAHFLVKTVRYCFLKLYS